MKYKGKVNLTSTGKASVEFEIEDAESLEEYNDAMSKFAEQELRRYGMLNQIIR